MNASSNGTMPCCNALIEVTGNKCRQKWKEHFTKSRSTERFLVEVKKGRNLRPFLVNE